MTAAAPAPCPAPAEARTARRPASHRMRALAGESRGEPPWRTWSAGREGDEAMKLKLNLNVDAVKRLLIQHGEKAAVRPGGAALLLCSSGRRCGWKCWPQKPARDAESAGRASQATRPHFGVGSQGQEYRSRRLSGPCRTRPAERRRLSSGGLPRQTAVGTARQAALAQGVAGRRI